ncbi:thioredoxin domain-containing protein [Halothiobacillus diazotrophicus]|nr:hypothetical protein [Halothiobacillus diazotrophicus]
MIYPALLEKEFSMQYFLPIPTVLSILLVIVSLSGCAQFLDQPGSADGPHPVDWAVQKDFYTRLMALPGIDTGSVYCDRHMVILFDPDCPACTEQWRILQPYFTRARIHWVPIGMTETSIQRGAALLAAINPSAALFANFDRFDSSGQTGGYPIGDPPQWAVENVRANTQSAVVREYIWGTPTLGIELAPDRYFGFTGVMPADEIGPILNSVRFIRAAPNHGFMAIKHRHH